MENQDGKNQVAGNAPLDEVHEANNHAQEALNGLGDALVFVQVSVAAQMADKAPEDVEIFPVR